MTARPYRVNYAINDKNGNWRWEEEIIDAVRTIIRRHHDDLRFIDYVEKLA